MWISGVILLVHMLNLIAAQGDPEFKHELPPGVELVNPKDFGLTDDQLGGLLSNVKVLGGSTIGDTKTQILTVGFEGDEDLNFDDFDIPGLTDKKPADIPDKDKEIANVAFEKFKEFFKDPKKSKSYEAPKSNDGGPVPQIISTPPSEQTNHVPDLRNNRNNPQKQNNNNNNNNNNGHRQYHRVRPSPESLQQHYPVQLTQPLNQQTTSRTTSRTVPVSQNPTQQNQQFNQNDNLHNHRLHYNPPNNNNAYMPQFQSAPQHPLRQSSHAIAFTNNNQPSHQNQEFGAKVSPTTHNAVPVANQPQLRPQEPQEYRTIPQQQGQNQYSPQLSQVNSQEEGKPISQPPYSNSLPPGNFQRFTIYPQHRPTTTSAPSPPRKEVGQVVRNQLLFNNDNQKNNQNSYQRVPPTQTQSHQPHRQRQQDQSPDLVPPQETQEYRTITQTQYPQPPPSSFQNPSSASSSSIPSLLQLFPSQDSQQPVSHVYIQQGSQGSPPVQQTSFHPRFQPPTKFANDFTPSVNHITTPVPHFEVTPSMPMILISTNENAITDPKRMELLRQQQRAMEEKRQRQLEHQQQSSKERQPHSLSYNKQVVTQTPHYNPFTNNHITDDPRPKPQNPQIYSPQNSYTQNQYRQYSSNNNANTNVLLNQQHHQNHHVEQQNSFNFQTQQQQHQLHTLQNLFYNTQTHPPSLPQRPYYQQQQQQAQPSTNYASSIPLGIQPPPPPRFQIRPEPHHQYYATRHKRGYRHRLSTILRGLWGDRDY